MVRNQSQQTRRDSIGRSNSTPHDSAHRKEQVRNIATAQQQQQRSLLSRAHDESVPRGRRQQQLSNAAAAAPSASSSTADSADDSASWSASSSASSAQPVADRYKTELCRSWEESGACRYGAKCQFAHGRAELRQAPRHKKYKTELCKNFHTRGACPYGIRCRFIHDELEHDTGLRAALGPERVAELIAMMHDPADIATPTMSPSHTPFPISPRPVDAPRRSHSSPHTAHRTAPPLALNKAMSAPRDQASRLFELLPRVSVPNSSLSQVSQDSDSSLTPGEVSQIEAMLDELQLNDAPETAHVPSSPLSPPYAADTLNPSEKKRLAALTSPWSTPAELPPIYTHPSPSRRAFDSVPASSDTYHPPAWSPHLPDLSTVCRPPIHVSRPVSLVLSPL